MQEKQEYPFGQSVKENWEYWEEEMGELYLKEDCFHVCSATDCTGLIPAEHKEEEAYENYEKLYAYCPNEEWVK